MSGEIIQMSSKQTMIFEPADVEEASPATVSRYSNVYISINFGYNSECVCSHYRCGMIYMEPAQLGWKPWVESWLERDLPATLSDDQRDMVKVANV